MVVGAAVIASVLGLLSALPTAIALPPKPTPVPKVTAAQVQAAYHDKQKLAALVGQLSAEVAQAQMAAQQAEGRKELAEQKVALTQSQLLAAQEARRKAQAALAAARKQAADARVQFVQYLQAIYMTGNVDGTAGSLLTASDPSELLEQSDLQRYQAAHKANAIGRMEQAAVARSNAEAAERRAVRASEIAKANAEQALQAAAIEAQQAQAAEANLEQQQAAQQKLLDQASLQLATLNNQRSAYLTYLAKKAAYDAAKREAERRAAERRARLAALAAARHRQHGGGGGGGGGSFNPGPPAPSGGSWSWAKAEQAVARARAQLGVPYAWAGGGVGGPSYGVCSPANGAPNDCYVRGFDCSGLVMYAWGQNWAHYAATQYGEAGSFHPSLNNLRPGDLLFWSYGGRWEIHHVAIYIGGGQIIQAPESGSYVMISNMYDPGQPYGATRPLT